MICTWMCGSFSVTVILIVDGCPMKITFVLRFFSFCCMFLCMFTGIAIAQTTESIGFNSVTGEALECIQFAESKFNTIRVINAKSGKQRVFTPKQATRKVKRLLKKVLRRSKTLGSTLRRLRKRLAKLAKSVRTPQAKLDTVKDQISKIDSRLAENEGDKELLKALLDGIKGCAEDADVIGDFRVFSQVYSLGSSTRFTAALYYSAVSNKKFRGLEARISGLSQRIPGAITAPIPEAPAVSYLTVRENHCLTQIVDEGCVKELPGKLALLISIVGNQAPDTCGTASPYRCSVGEAVALLTGMAGRAEVEILKKIK